ncbi:Leucine-rich repeat transmembrane neuronal protein 3 [Zootermopsis nevadensis]|uniref:Leucine-rich repeat transmembrane neuronal protein 3 n=2 Tax=Zootermopsis nevadensis TaxID=136037 RepID=A0A067QH55_ZOONE|nr:Leucine-rich repeat transmembrane neuronal protein 3 [Zootermopsis nevadensis]
MYSASHLYIRCPSICACPSNFKMLCKNSSLTETPEVPNTVITLDLSYNSISDLTNTSFSNKGTNQLTSLYIYNNKIRNIEREAFVSLKNLKSLFMGNNKLTYIHPDAFISIKNLEELDLHGNNINLGDEGPFRHLVNLFSLNIANCNLGIIPNATFQRTVKLSRIDMSNNKLTHIDDHLFDNLYSLQFLNLTGNLLTSVDFLLVLSTETLQEMSLYVHDNKIENLNSTVLERMNVLKNIKPLFCRCWDRNLLLNVLRQCSEHTNYTHDCLNKTADISATEAITMEVSAGGELFYDNENEATIIPQDISGLNIAKKDFNDSTDDKILQNSSENLSETDVIIITVTMSITLVILVAVMVMCFLMRILKERTSVSDEYDSVPHENNDQHVRQCDVCQIYQNYTPNCEHRLSRQNMKTSQKNKLKFAIQQHHVAVLEAFEMLTQEGNEESCLYVQMNEEKLRDITNSHSECAQMNSAPNTIPCDKETAGLKHSSCTPENHEDTVLMCVGKTSGYDREITTFREPSQSQHSCSRAVSYVPRPSDGVHLSGKNRHSCLQYFNSPSWSPTSESHPVPKRVESLMDKRWRRTLSSSPRQMQPRSAYGIVISRSPPVSHSLNTEHLYEELK